MMTAGFMTWPGKTSSAIRVDLSFDWKSLDSMGVHLTWGPIDSPRCVAAGSTVPIMEIVERQVVATSTTARQEA